MAKYFESPSVEAFGLTVEMMNSEKRNKMLGLFYRQRRDFLKELGLEGVDEEL
jgi:hypothetical protein